MSWSSSSEPATLEHALRGKGDLWSVENTLGPKTWPAVILIQINKKTVEQMGNREQQARVETKARYEGCRFWRSPDCGEVRAILAVFSRGVFFPAFLHSSASPASSSSLYSELPGLNYPTSWLQFQVYRPSSEAPPELCIERGPSSTSPHIDRCQRSTQRASWLRRRMSCRSSGNEFRSLPASAISF